MGSPGLETVRWHQPVRPGDTITMQARVLRSWPSTTRDDRGYIDMSFEVLNQRDELVLSYTCVEILKRKSAA
jgi:acyl dehydratase